MGFTSFPVIDQEATGRNIVRLREKSGLTVADLQKYFGFDAPQAIYKWQNGKCLPKTDHLVALGYLLHVPMEEILVTRLMKIESMPQEQSCGMPRFGELLILLFFSALSKSEEMKTGLRRLWNGYFSSRIFRLASSSKRIPNSMQLLRKQRSITLEA